MKITVTKDFVLISEQQYKITTIRYHAKFICKVSHNWYLYITNGIVEIQIPWILKMDSSMK